MIDALVEQVERRVGRVVYKDLTTYDYVAATVGLYGPHTVEELVANIRRERGIPS